MNRAVEGSPRRRVLAAAAVVVARLAFPAPASAQPLADGDYVLDIVDLPVLGANRAVGLGGAYSAVGEGITAVPYNPAAAATRAPHEDAWFEWEIGLGGMFPTSGSSTRVFGNSMAPVATDGFTYFDTGLRFQFGPAGVAAVARPRRFSYTDSLGNRQELSSQIAHFDGAWTLGDGSYTVGAGLRFLNLDVTAAGLTRLGIRGVNVEAGLIARPAHRSYRYAVSFRGPIRADRVDVDPTADVLIAVPRAAVAPWELSLAGSFSFGERPFNPPHAQPTRRRVRRRAERVRTAAADATANAATTAAVPVIGFGAPRAPAAFDPSVAATRVAGSRFASASRPTEPRRYGVVSAEFLVVGRTADGVGLDGFLTQQRIAWGRHATVSARLGIEGEPWRDRMKLRAGVYVEPARPSAATPRPHVTSGFDFRLFRSRFWGMFDEPVGIQLGATADIASNYRAFGFGVGIWH